MSPWLAVIMMLAGLADQGDAVESRQWEQTYGFGTPTPTVQVRNIWGPVTVDVHDDDTVIVRVRERRSAPDARRLELSRELIFLNVEETPERLLLEVDGIVRDDWQRRYGANPCRGCRLQLDFHLTVPRHASVDVGTVMDGTTTVDSVTGPVSASNVNGDVAVSAIRNCREIRTVNGWIQVAFATAPSHESCAIQTINGDMTVALPPGPGSDHLFRLGHGRIVSEFEPRPLALPVQVERQRGDTGTRLRVSHPTGIRIGAGGPQFSYESINGDVLIRSADRFDMAATPIKLQGERR